MVQYLLAPQAGASRRSARCRRADSAPLGGFASISKLIRHAQHRRRSDPCRKVVFIGHANGLHHRQAIARLDLEHALGAFRSVQLDDVDRNGVQDCVHPASSMFTVRADLGHTGRHHRGQMRGLFDRHIARGIWGKRQSRHSSRRPQPPRSGPHSSRRPQILTRMSEVLHGIRRPCRRSRSAGRERRPLLRHCRISGA